MKARHLFKLPAKAKKNTLYLIAFAGVSGLTIQVAPSTIHNLIPSPDVVGEKIRVGLDGVFRSSRAIYTITTTIVDYKYSLHGFPLDSDEYLRELSKVHLRSARRILKLCEENRGFYVKAGQFVAAMRQVPKEYSSTLSSLQDKAVPCHFKAIKKVLENNLGQDLSELFLSFDKEPIAAASIAQVHRAVLKDYEEVAIKVQYPGLENQMKIDITTMSFLSKSISWIFPEYRFKWMVSEFEKTISLELDFVQEAKNSERTARNFKKNPILMIPRVFWDFTTSQVLTMQFCEGRKVDDLEFMKGGGINPTKVVEALVEVFAEMIFVHGFVHGDPHPGNILISSEGRNGFSIVLLDHGIYKEFDEEFRLNYCQLWKALILQDAKKIESLGEHFGVGKYSRYFPVIFTGRTIDSKSTLGRGMSDEERRNLKLDLKSLRTEDLSSFMESLPPNFLTILRTDGLLKSIINKLGVPQRVRLLAYAKYSIYGLSRSLKPEPDLKPPSYHELRVTFLKKKVETTQKWIGFAVKYVLSDFMGMIGYFKLRLFLEFLELISTMENLRHLFVSRLKHMLFGAVHLLVGVNSSSTP